MVAITDERPTTSTIIITPSPSCVPATLSSPARVPCDRLLATISVTVGPGMMVMTKQATT
jgi:hypothetical protein